MDEMCIFVCKQDIEVYTDQVEGKAKEESPGGNI